VIYSVSDIKSTEKQYIKSLIFLGVFIFLMLAASIVLGLFKYVTEGTIVIVAACIISIFVYGMYVSPLHRYTNYLSEVITGTKHKVTCVIKSISQKPIYKDNKLYFYEITVNVYNNEFDRLYLFDANVDLPDIHVEDEVNIVYYENFIVGIESFK